MSLIYFRELLQRFVGRHSRVPVLFGDPVEAGKHDGQDDAGVLLDQAHDVLVVPVVQSSLCNLGNKQTGLSV